ncbi:patatin-like phospholipase family protein [Burkholderia gladioli]|uniref:patatin-like phospholipase family protein n=1 Tax=Burkholderia gladioli TaxID=28095 RepID=UPI001ABB10F0|nr:patatin-like phospholipase family protein [Burkholderia gladioli]MDN7805804.1 patatin-like phospholipase family protein [Burkholderia gladioli]
MTVIQNQDMLGASDHTAASRDDALPRLGLAVSGGGVRAAAFHAGVMKYLAEAGSLEHVQHISSVSGGSLFIGLVLSRAGYKWPSSQQYRDFVYNDVKSTLTSTSLQLSSAIQLFANPLNWRFFLSRANVLEKTIRSVWKIDAPLSALDNSPTWSVNGTTAETGRRFRFKNGSFGDYQLGYADTNSLSLASALAVSAAFPGGIGPLSIKTDRFNWQKRSEWDSGEPAVKSNPPFKKLHLYDGGVYDNLGIEPLFDCGAQSLKKGEGTPHINRLVVSDAGAPFVQARISHPLNPLRFKRIADIALDQTRALRVRSFANFLIENPGAGLYLQIGADPRAQIATFGSGRAIQSALMATDWLDVKSVKAAAAVPTSLNRMSEEEFLLVSQHGYETARWNNELWMA